MLRWLIQDVDTKNENSVHPYIKGLFQLTEKGLDQPFWFGISYEALKAFLIYANFSIDELTSNNLNGVVRDIAKIKLPSEMRNQIRRLILNEGLLDSKFEVEILIFVPEEPTYKLPWDPLCESSAIGVEGVFQSIKACWSSLFHPTILNSLNSMGLDYSKVNISLFIRVHQQELMRGSAYSYSPRSPWDRQHLVVSQTTIKDQAAFLVDRNTLQITYYGKSGEELLGAAKKLKTSKLNPHKNLPDHEKIKKIAGFLLSCEKNLGKEQQLEWSITSEQRILIRRISSFVRSPSTQQMSPQINTNFLNFWDQTILSWNASALLKPFWFSLLPRNFRALSIRYAGILGIKSKLPPEYEKVFRGFWGILRGRPYLNLAAFHRFISIGQHKELAEELSLIIPHWMKRYDRESRDAWDFQWPKTIQFNKEFSKNILKNQNKILKEFPEKLNIWIDQIHGLREELVSQKWKEKNIFSMLESFQVWEQKYLPGFVPILVAELQYWNLISWYYQGAKQPSIIPTWERTEIRDRIKYEGTWLSRRQLDKKFEQLEMLTQLRPKYLAMLDDVFDKLRKYFEQLGEKIKSLGQIEKSDDLFFLTFEELLAFEEGRASTTSWKSLISLRREEYQTYARDQKVPEVWMTTGLVGVAAQYPGVISIRDRKNPYMEYYRPQKTTRKEVGLSRAIDFLDFIDDQNVNSVLKSEVTESEPIKEEEGLILPFVNEVEKLGSLKD